LLLRGTFLAVTGVVRGALGLSFCLIGLAGCTSSDPEARVAGRVSGVGVGDAQPATSCPEKLQLQGCCDGQTLWWCERGLLWSQDCSGAPKCGWSDSGHYSCDTAGAVDPAGIYPKDCGQPFGAPPAPAPSHTCGGIGREGCCDGDTLKYCEDGELQTVNCAFAPECGWRPSTPMSGHYDCGTAGDEAPRGLFPRLCPGARPPGETIPDLIVVSDATVDGGDSHAGEGGGGCATAPKAATGSGWWLGLGLLLLLLRATR
jgi:hypothetical protein